MIRDLNLTMRVTCDDGEVFEVSLTDIPTLFDTEDARCLFQLNHVIESSTLSKAQAMGAVVYDEELLRVMLSRLRSRQKITDTWPDGTEARDLLDRVAIALCSKLRLRGAPPPE